MQHVYPIACICGSTRFKKEHMRAAEVLILRGYVVVMVNAWEHADRFHDPQDSDDILTKAMLDDMHKYKIAMSDLIYIVNKNGYIGESTKSEIAYAQKLGKKIEWLEPHDT